jgi:hypothetical protein
MDILRRLQLVEVFALLRRTLGGVGLVEAKRLELVNESTTKKNTIPYRNGENGEFGCFLLFCTIFVGFWTN